MSYDPTAPLSAMRGGIWLQRLVGGAALASGLVLGWLFSYGLYWVSLLEKEVEAVVVGFLAALAALAAFLLSSGLRLLLNRENKYGSAFSPATWFIAAGMFFAGGTFLVSKAVASGAPSVAFKPILYAFFFGALAAWAGLLAIRRARRRPSSAA